MKERLKAPELRFPGFTDDWEERKLKELFQPSKNKNNNGLYNQKDILAASLGTELIPKRTFFGLKSTKESVKNYRIVKTGDLIYTKSPIKGFPNGIIRSNKGNVGIVPPLYCVYTLQKDINSSIIQLYFEDKNRLDFYLFPLVNVGARNNVNITDLEFLEGKVTIPKSYEEQSKIVQFMEQLNNTIALHQRKLDLLKEQKKGYLQKMFPKNGAKVPELRFAGFADDWEERKFDECFNFPVSTNSLSRALLNYDEGDIKSVHYGDILIKYPAILNIKNDKIPYITGGKLEKYKSSLLENGDLIFADAAEDETVGKAVEVNGLTEENLVAGLHTIVARPKDKKAEFFLGYYINSNTYHRQLLRLIQGSKVSSISKGNLQKTLVSFPKDFEEQQKIGAFFKKIDDTIALHQRKLDLLKEQKKGFLQKMFV
ncbi:restriction endonuclease subunit S [Lactococcus lactis]|uniref:restriction endonuclease subunit S n=1 Tax=Lactococcus lactis TaxID=1358 RepID=UPI001C112C3B|nr:restriction endonuclease subunit S [Lactococcus lactis]MBU5244024.1 restriction endonuclease subunit S [Lactococcus lactis]